MLSNHRDSPPLPPHPRPVIRNPTPLSAEQGYYFESPALERLERTIRGVTCPVCASAELGGALGGSVLSESGVEVRVAACCVTLSAFLLSYYCCCCCCLRLLLLLLLWLFGAARLLSSSRTQMYPL